MYFGDGKLPTWNFNESLSSSFPRDSFETFSFDSGLMIFLFLIKIFFGSFGFG